MKPLFVFAVMLVLVSCESWAPSNEDVLQSPNVSNGQLAARYFGASTILISDGEHSVLIDGFFSRPGKLYAMKHGINSLEASIQEIMNFNNIKEVDVLLLSHAHYDHILDSGRVAYLKDSIVIGSNLAIKKMSENVNGRGGELKVFPVEVMPDDFPLVPFNIKYFKTPHAPKSFLMQGIEYLYLHKSDGLNYREEGDNYSFLIQHPLGKILVVPSAGFSEGMLQDIEDVDVVFLSVGLLGKQSCSYIKKYWSETVEKTGAKVVIPIHWDNLSGQSLKPTLWPVDNLSKTFEIFQKLADKNESVSLKLPGKFGELFRLDHLYRN
ncbi:MAG: hypothetical protein COB04_19465 [Gammaproteobacteria bacterium]|nr:MAG: hypothetical protein COB04_19465 [Gammaproteobacteria bacterium]